MFKGEQIYDRLEELYEWLQNFEHNKSVGTPADKAHLEAIRSEVDHLESLQAKYLI